MDYNLIRTKRKTVAIYIRDAGVIVRAPLRMPLRDIERFVTSKRAWIEKHLAEQRASAERLSGAGVSKGQIDVYKKQARETIGDRIAYFAPLMGVAPAIVRIGSAKRSWGSCTSAGKLSFSWRLMLAEPDEIDYVVVHELAHLKQLNHSASFWAIVAGVIPDHKARRKKLHQLQKQYLW